MLSKITVFVLGAGASAPYKFPTGWELERGIINSLEDCNAGEWSNVLREMFNTTDLCTFQRKLRRAGAGSVDAFLEHNDAFLDVGKACIARALIPHEEEHRLFDGRPRNWYDALWKALRAPTADQLANQDVTFVTFNYDRSLEHYLYTAVQDFYNVDGCRARELLASMPIIHVHGCLGPLGYEGDTSEARAYSPELAPDRIRLAMKGVRIVHEAATNDPLFEQARAKLLAAQRVCFLGFGFNENNVRRLEPWTWSEIVDVLAISHNLGERLPKATQKLFKPTVRFMNCDMDYMIREHID